MRCAEGAVLPPMAPQPGGAPCRIPMRAHFVFRCAEPVLRRCPCWHLAPPAAGSRHCGGCAAGGGPRPRRRREHAGACSVLVSLARLAAGRPACGWGGCSVSSAALCPALPFCPPTLPTLPSCAPSYAPSCAPSSPLAGLQGVPRVQDRRQPEAVRGKGVSRPLLIQRFLGLRLSSPTDAPPRPGPGLGGTGRYSSERKEGAQVKKQTTVEAAELTNQDKRGEQIQPRLGHSVYFFTIHLCPKF